MKKVLAMLCVTCLCLVPSFSLAKTKTPGVNKTPTVKTVKTPKVKKVKKTTTVKKIAPTPKITFQGTVTAISGNKYTISVTKKPKTSRKITTTLADTVVITWKDKVKKNAKKIKSDRVSVDMTTTVVKVGDNVSVAGALKADGSVSSPMIKIRNTSVVAKQN